LAGPIRTPWKIPEGWGNAKRLAAWHINKKAKGGQQSASKSKSDPRTTPFAIFTFPAT